MTDSGLTIAYANDEGRVRDALVLLGYETESWPAQIEKPKFMFNRRTGLRAKITYELSRARWVCSLTWER